VQSKDKYARNEDKTAAVKLSPLRLLFYISLTTPAKSGICSWVITKRKDNGICFLFAHTEANRSCSSE